MLSCYVFQYRKDVEKSHTHRGSGGVGLQLSKQAELGLDIGGGKDSMHACL